MKVSEVLTSDLASCGNAEGDVNITWELTMCSRSIKACKTPWIIAQRQKPLHSCQLEEDASLKDFDQ